MYVILPGEMGYEGSYRFVAAARRVIEEAGELLKDDDFATAENVNELTPEQQQLYQHYTDTAGKLLDFYIENGNEPATEEYGELFAMFAYALASDKVFHSMVENYFRAINDALNELIKSSRDRSIRVRGADRMLEEYTCIGITIQRLSELDSTANFAVIDTMADLYVD